MPRLQALLHTLVPAPVVRPSAAATGPLLMPHEAALAQALGWPADAPPPWAAWQSQLHTDTAQAWVTPCHWQVGMNDVVMRPPEALALTDTESQDLLAAMQELLTPAGLQLRWHGHALRWHISGAALVGWALPSPDRVLTGHADDGAVADVRPWLADVWPRQWAAWHSEMQMLAYNHPVNDARLARGLPAVNAFWLHGAGALPPAQASAAQAPEPLHVLEALQAPTRLRDVQAWRRAWQALDAQLPAPHTPGLRLTLCSDSGVQHWHARGSGPWARWHRQWRAAWHPTQTDTVLNALATP